MVKPLDDLSYPAPIDHIGWRLWRLAWAWKVRFEAEMVGLGHAWFGEARSAVLAHLGPKGTPQSSLPGRIGLTKQAVQQLVDGLVEDGVVERRSGSGGPAQPIIALTPAGLAVMADADTVKRRIEADYRDMLGAGRFDGLSRILDELPENRQPGTGADHRPKKGVPKDAPSLAANGATRYCTASPCTARSRPSRSASSETRRPITALIRSSSTRVTTAAPDQGGERRRRPGSRPGRGCRRAGRCRAPLIAGSAKTPVRSAPTMPPTPCTPNTSSESS